MPWFHNQVSNALTASAEFFDRYTETLLTGAQPTRGVYQTVRAGEVTLLDRLACVTH